MLTKGINRSLTVLSLTIVVPGMLLTYNGVKDMRVVGMTALAAVWLAVAMLIFYRTTTTERLRAYRRPPQAAPPVLPHRQRAQKTYRSCRALSPRPRS